MDKTNDIKLKNIHTCLRRCVKICLGMLDFMCLVKSQLHRITQILRWVKHLSVPARATGMMGTCCLSGCGP